MLLAYENEAIFSRIAGPRPAVRDPEGDDPDREPDRRPQDEPGQGRGERVHPLPEDAGGAAGLRRLRLPAGREERLERNRKKFPARPGLFTIDQLGLGGWTKVQKQFFDPKTGIMAGSSARSAAPLASIAVAAPRRARRLEGQGRDGPVPRLRHDLPDGHGRPAARRARLGGDERGHAELLGRGLEPEAVAALKLTLGASLVVSLLNAVLGTITAWVLVRDDFRGKSLVNAIIDLPFALPTIVAGLTLLALYGPTSPIGINVAYTRSAIVLALMFVTLPFVVRTVQPVLQELDAEVEQAAHSLGASNATTFRRIVFPNILPGILSGVALAFAKAVGEFGSLVIITGNLPFKTEVSSVYIFGRIESGDTAGAAAVAVVLLAISFVTLLSIGVIRHFATRHDRA